MESLLLSPCHCLVVSFCAQSRIVHILRRCFQQQDSLNYWFFMHFSRLVSLLDPGIQILRDRHPKKRGPIDPTKFREPLTCSRNFVGSVGRAHVFLISNLSTRARTDDTDLLQDLLCKILAGEGYHV